MKQGPLAHGGQRVHPEEPSASQTSGTWTTSWFTGTALCVLRLRITIVTAQTCGGPSHAALATNLWHYHCMD